MSQNQNRMSHMPLDAAASAPLYARFSRRFRGIVVDWAIAMAVLFGAVMLAVSVENDNFSRALGCLVIATLLLYEPILVSFTGGTLGHHLTNLRVVDDRSGGNVSFLKACARVVLKGVLGWYSFVILAATRRNQAVHDLLTRSTVQIRDPAKARSGQYITERVEPVALGMPSPVRRAAVICVYWLLLFVSLLVILAAMAAAGLMSRSCVYGDYCSGVDRMLNLVTSVAFLVMLAVVVALGWKGRLFGARKA
ncbi:RDD family protein [Bradyrhizobium sp. AUGA SZCCT0042]|uniref:RDD family protein n=2 Tax=Bradyrhizobium TaxID=374 RepID=UPI001BA8AA13|nr:RDD family protein [Bradyrhizobium sp. AUGA SZCCT0042]MBR1300129.1 RDD family protein [Bradyrhizobium sp. AUGA SZCCT0042]